MLCWGILSDASLHGIVKQALQNPLIRSEYRQNHLHTILMWPCPFKTLSYSSKINGYLYLQRVSWKKCRDMFSEGNAAHPVGCDSPPQIVMAVRHTFLIWTCWVECGSLLLSIMALFKFKKRAPNSQYYLQQAVTPDEITEQNSSQRAGAP